MQYIMSIFQLYISKNSAQSSTARKYTKKIVEVLLALHSIFLDMPIFFRFIANLLITIRSRSVMSLYFNRLIIKKSAQHTHP